MEEHERQTDVALLHVGPGLLRYAATNAASYVVGVRSTTIEVRQRKRCKFVAARIDT